MRRPNSLLAMVTKGAMGVPPDPLKGIDIAREYELIRRKQSKLPKAMRDLVVRRVEKKGVTGS